MIDELEKTSHRRYTTGFNFKDKKKEESEYLESSMPIQTHEFMAIVTKDSENGEVEIQQRNKFVVGEELEVLAPHKNFNKIIKVTSMKDLNGEEIAEAKIVQQTLKLKTDLELKAGDILRKKITE